MNNIPQEVSDDETIVRVIVSWHLKKGKLHRNAFDSPKDKDEVSVIRFNYKDADFCKTHGKTKVQNPALTPQKLYKGLAAMRAKSIREVGSDVVDSRKIFEGHADIKHGIVRMRDDPPEAALLKALNDRLDQLLEKVRYFEDPAPERYEWTVPPIVAP